MWLQWLFNRLSWYSLLQGVKINFEATKVYVEGAKCKQLHFDCNVCGTTRLILRDYMAKGSSIYT